MLHCKACDSSFPANRMKPATINISLQSSFTDLMIGFPTNQLEELCPKCINSISSYNSDLYSVVSDTLKEGDVITTPDTFQTAFLKAEAEYQGYSDIETFNQIELGGKFN